MSGSAFTISPNAARSSYFVGTYLLQSSDYRVYFVNPNADEILGHKAPAVGEAAARVGMRLDRSELRDVAAEFAKFASIIHPDANRIRNPTPDEFARVEESIRQRGQQVSIFRLDGLILDGRTRYAACKRLGIKPLFKDGDLADGETAFDVVFEFNAARRHLTAAECKAVA